FDIGEVLFARGTEHSQQIVLMIGSSQSIELLAELTHEQRDIRLLGTALKFPVDVDAVKDPRSRNTRSQIAIDEQIDARGDEGLAACVGRSGYGESGRTRERDQHFQVGVQLLELLECREVAVERAGVRPSDGRE